MGDNTDQSPPKSAQDVKPNGQDPDRRYEALVAASAKIVLTMLCRGKFLEEELKRALDHVRMSNEALGKFLELLDSVDGERQDGGESARSWKDVAERVKTVVTAVDRTRNEKGGGQDSAKEKRSIVGKDGKGESNGAP